MKILVTRHSKILWNSENRLQGWQDSTLSAMGINDALKLKDYLKAINIDVIYSSPLSRAKETTKILFGKRIINYDHRLKEMCFGDFEGKYVKELLETSSVYNDLWNNPSDDLSLPNGETYLQVKTRLIEFLNKLYKKHQNDTVFITTHGMTFIILHGIIEGYKVSEYTKINRQVVRGCSLSEFTYDGATFNINYIGKDDFLDKQNETISYAK